MKTDLRPYPEYKESGLPWLGHVPAHWRVNRLATIATVRSEKGRPDLPLLSVFLNRGVIPYGQGGGQVHKPSLDLTNYQVVKPGNLVLNNQQAWRGSVGVSYHLGIISPAYFVMELPEECNAVFCDFLFQSWPMVTQFVTSSKGVGDIQRDIYLPWLKNAVVAFPPPEEQRVLARFLREINQRISRFIRNQRRLIGVLNEQKQAIINRAVTRGLDPNVPIRPSGIEWLNEIPEHWDERRLRNIVELRVSNVDKHSKDGEIPVRLCNYTDVYKNSVITAEMPFMAATATLEEITTFHIRVGDVLITKDSEDWQDIGVPAVVVQTADDLVCGYHLAILRPKTSFIIGRFLAYAMQCRSAVTHLNLAAKGVTRYGLSQGAIKSLSLAVPSVDEQEEIVLHIEEAIASLNGLVRRAQCEIDLIREYRTRLIADVVTGKLDVRHLSPDIDAKLVEPGEMDEDINDEGLLGDEEPELDEED